MSKHILIVEDEKDLLDTLEYNFKNAGYKVSITLEGNKAISLATGKNNPDLVILDLMLPDISGLDVCKAIRNNPVSKNTPILMLTAKGEEVDRILGFELGADDYLGKPFEPRELLARIQSILRRVHSANSMLDLLVFEGLSIDKLREEVLLDGEPISLSTSEFEALLLFANNSNEVLDREFLVENLRGITWQTYDRSVDVLVSRLRNKLGETPHHTRFLKTIHGVGYKFIATPK